MILIDSEFKNQPNIILIYERTENQVREILNPNPAPQFLGLKLLLAIGRNPMLLVRDREHVSVVDFVSGTLVNLFFSPIEVDQMSAFYLDVTRNNGIYEIFTIEYIKGAKSQVIKHVVPEMFIR